jgi:photosystem II stability/assembly factor-like uncharacterized protein
MNGGVNWRVVSAGWGAAALAIDPVTPGIVYAGSYKSMDGGASWIAINDGFTNAGVVALAIDPAAPTTIYAGTSSGVFKSTDGGGNWTSMNTHLTTIDVRALAIDPATPTTLYAGTGGGGVFVIQQAK